MTRNQHRLFGSPLAKLALALLIVSSIFQGLSILTIRLGPHFEVGIGPYWVVAAFLVLAAVPALAKRRDRAAPPLSGPLRWAAISLGVFALYGVASAFSLPFVFRGAAVLDPRLGIASQFMEPSSLSWSLSNAGQAGYMLINCAVFWLLILGVRTHEDLRMIYRFILAAGWLVLGFAVFQRLSTAYFPNGVYPALYGITHNNPAASSYPVLDPRTTAFFLEPSFLGGFAAMMLAIGLCEYLDGFPWSSLALGLVSAYVILTSESTVGLALIPFGLILALVPWVWRGTSRREVGRRLGMPRRIRNVLLGLFCAIVLFSGEHAAQSVLGPLQAPTPTQSESAGGMQSPVAVAASPQPAPPPTRASAQPAPVTPAPNPTGPASGLLDLGSRPWADRLLSVKYRLWADQFSVFNVTRATWFLGAGLGSNRPSSFLAYVLSNMGLPGLVALAAFIILVVVSWTRYMESLGQPAMSLCAGFFTYLVAMAGGLPDPSWPPFLWIFGGLVVAGLSLAARPAEASTPASSTQ